MSENEETFSRPSGVGTGINIATLVVMVGAFYLLFKLHRKQRREKLGTDEMLKKYTNRFK